jgi:hypothetical protein
MSSAVPNSHPTLRACCPACRSTRVVIYRVIAPKARPGVVERHRFCRDCTADYVTEAPVSVERLTRWKQPCGWRREARARLAASGLALKEPERNCSAAACTMPIRRRPANRQDRL